MTFATLPYERSFTEQASAHSNATLTTAERFQHAQYSFIPIRLDGSKAPACDWKLYQQVIALRATLLSWFGGPRPFGLALVHGAISDNSEVIDVDCGECFGEFYAQVLAQLPALSAAPLVKTPREGGGYQLFYRNEMRPSGNLVLARRPDPCKPGKFTTAIETRGEGGYTVTIGSPPAVHPTKRPYRLVSGSFRTVPVLTEEERAALDAIALGFNQEPVGEVRHSEGGQSAGDGTRPGDDFNRYASWARILEPHGWRQVGRSDAPVHWRRPGKPEGHCATTNYADSDLLYVFSSNAAPFEEARAYTKFAAFALLEHRGNFHAAAREIVRWRTRR